RSRTGTLQGLRESVPVKNVVTQRERYRRATDELRTDQKRLRESFGFRLNRVLEREAEFLSVSQQTAEQVDVHGRTDDENVPDARQHQRGQRVVHHRLV